MAGGGEVGQGLVESGEKGREGFFADVVVFEDVLGEHEDETVDGGVEERAGPDFLEGAGDGGFTGAGGAVEKDNGVGHGRFLDRINRIDGIWGGRKRGLRFFEEWG
jgi:hypothetical protein